MSDMLKTAGTIREIERLRASLLVAKQLNAELVAALEAVDSEILLTGHLQEIVSTALTNAKEG